MLLDNNLVELHDIELTSHAFTLYHKMTRKPDSGCKIIGKGEASALALAHEHKGIVASNNFRDINYYVANLDLNYTTTGDILVEAFDSALITEEEGNTIWKEMIAADRWIGAQSFSEYKEKPYKPLLRR